MGPDGQKIELKRIISQREYKVGASAAVCCDTMYYQCSPFSVCVCVVRGLLQIAVQTQSDRSRRIVRQKRTSFLYDNRYFEICHYVRPCAGLVVLNVQVINAASRHTVASVVAAAVAGTACSRCVLPLCCMCTLRPKQATAEDSIQLPPGFQVVTEVTGANTPITAALAHHHHHHCPRLTRATSCKQMTPSLVPITCRCAYALMCQAAPRAWCLQQQQQSEAARGAGSSSNAFLKATASSTRNHVVLPLSPPSSSSSGSSSIVTALPLVTALGTLAAAFSAAAAATALAEGRAGAAAAVAEEPAPDPAPAPPPAPAAAGEASWAATSGALPSLALLAVASSWCATCNKT